MIIQYFANVKTKQQTSSRLAWSYRLIRCALNRHWTYRFENAFSSHLFVCQTHMCGLNWTTLLENISVFKTIGAKVKMESLKEIPQLLNDDTRADIKDAIVNYLLGLYRSHKYRSYRAVLSVMFVGLISMLIVNYRFDWIWRIPKRSIPGAGNNCSVGTANNKERIIEHTEKFVAMHC